MSQHSVFSLRIYSEYNQCIPYCKWLDHHVKCCINYFTFHLVNVSMLQGIVIKKVVQRSHGFKRSKSLQEPVSSIVYQCRDDYKFSEMIGQNPLIATLAPNLIGHPYIALER